MKVRKIGDKEYAHRTDVAREARVTLATVDNAVDNGILHRPPYKGLILYDQKCRSWIEYQKGRDVKPGPKPKQGAT